MLAGNKIPPERISKGSDFVPRTGILAGGLGKASLVWPRALHSSITPPRQSESTANPNCDGETADFIGR